MSFLQFGLLKTHESKYDFIAFKERFSLFYPHPDIVELCKLAEQEAKVNCNSETKLFKKSLMGTLTHKTIGRFFSNKPGFFEELKSSEHDVSHRYVLLKKIVNTYFQKRLRREAKVFNIDKRASKIRPKLVKTILQKHE